MIWLAQDAQDAQDGLGRLPPQFTGRMGMTPVFIFMDFADLHHVPYFRCIPAIYEGDPILGPYQNLVAAFRFLRTRIVDTVTTPLPRGQRRFLERKNIKVPAIQTVVLRKRDITYTTDEPSRAVNWSCQWIVRGHWRKSARASIETPTLSYVHEYVKGPGDKPLKMPRPRVHVATR